MSTTGSALQRDLTAFRAEAESFLAASLPRRVQASVVWGEGSDEIVDGGDRDRGASTVEAARQWRRRLDDAGYGWIDGPSEHGGASLSAEHVSIFRSLEAQHETPDQHLLRFGVTILCPALVEFGSEYLQRAYLRPLRRGDVVACQLFSEPGAGSDLAGLSMRAERDGDDWVLTGHKVWSSGAHLSQLGLAIARTGAEPGQPKQAGMTAFLVDLSAPGVDIRPIEQLNGDSKFNEVRLDGVRVPDSHRVGEVGEGWTFATASLRYERASIGADNAVDVSLVPRLVALARHLGVEEDAHVRQGIAEVHARAVATRAMTAGLFAAAGDQPPGAEMSACKLELTDNIQRAIDVAFEMLGERAVLDTGEWGTYAWLQLAWRLPGMRIGGGTDEILRNVIAERVLGLPREKAPR
ncbi:acyl-CoA dehydrogenase family protein [Nocardioides sp. zg-ZUI104]|uniref:acyl-CoA dehydrogenase family protein n=1 Tax=Nocardioides faecalis TaxID=2803858 RepID=UPI001BCB357C|nr:acyl-CoA dehydrogenase family protein [Nocardioides faecalis]MBS4754535.1 acyl-CoA dehydrogenase family protein [Nocardioides faecalis]